MRAFLILASREARPILFALVLLVAGMDGAAECDRHDNAIRCKMEQD